MSAQVTNKYHGLINQGATCYLNSVLQVLFMTKDFRDAVTRFSEENPGTECIDRHLKSLFDDLQNYTAYTCNITKKLGIENVYEQRDAAEYFERLLRLASPETSQIFHGMLANKTTCSKCHTEADTDAPFWHLPLSLVDSCTGTSQSEVYSVVTGIEEFLKPADLNGDNQMYCDQCDDKADATIRDVIKHHSDVLILLLKRFEFNYNYMSYVKINCVVEVPYTLQIPESQTYDLYAVVDHFGDLRSGHYTSTIRIQEEHEDRWYEFDDTKVTVVDKQLFQVNNTENRSRTAYLLFYRKRNDTADTGAQVSKDEEVHHLLPDTPSETYDQQKATENKRKREEREETAEIINDTAKLKKLISVRSGGAEVSPGLCHKVHHLDKEIYETADSDLQETVQDLENAEVDDVRKSRSGTEVSEGPEACDLPNKYEINKTQGILRNEKTDKDRKTEYEQPEKNTPHPDDKGLDDVGQNLHGYQGGKENNRDEKIGADKLTRGKCYDTLQDSEIVSDRKENILKEDQRHKQEKGQSKKEKSAKKNKNHNDIPNIQGICVKNSTEEAPSIEQQTRDAEDKRTPGHCQKVDHLYKEIQEVTTGSDLDHEFKETVRDHKNAEVDDVLKCCDTLQDSEIVSDRKDEAPSVEQQTRVVEDESTGNTSDAKNCQKSKSIMENLHFSEGVEMKNRRREYEFEQYTAEKISGAGTTQKDVSVEEQNKQQENEGSTKQTQINETSSLRQAGSKRRENPTENRGAGSSKKTREKEIRRTPDSKSNEMTARNENIEKTPQSYTKRTVKNNERNADEKSDPTKDSIDTFLTSFELLNLHESQEEGQKRATKRKQRKDNNRIHLKKTKMLQFSNDEIEPADENYAESSSDEGKTLCFCAPRKKINKKRQTQKKHRYKKAKWIKTFKWFQRTKQKNVD